jgi:hypothetical protein
VRRALLLVTLLTGCVSAELAPPRLIAREGAASRRTIRRVVALPATCGGMINAELLNNGDPTYTPGMCTPQILKGADHAIRSALEFQGLTVIDSEKVNAVTASRHEVEVRSSYATTTTTEVHGSLFEDATPNEQNEILKELGADALLNTRVLIGSAIGAGMRRSVIVQVRLRTVEDGQLVWARRCEIEAGGMTTDTIAIEQGTKCAIERPR